MQGSLLTQRERRFRSKARTRFLLQRLLRQRREQPLLQLDQAFRNKELLNQVLLTRRKQTN
jgi:hypothetical protein